MKTLFTLFALCLPLTAQSINGVANQSIYAPGPYAVGAGSVNAMTACSSPPISTASLTTGFTINVLPNAANTTTTPTLSVCGSSATTIVKSSGGSLVALGAGDYTTGVIAQFLYTGSFWQLLDPQTGSGGIPYPGAGVPNSTGTAWGTSFGVQGTDAKLLSTGTVSGVGATLCTDANGGATTTGCSGGAAGSLTASSTAAPASVNLTTEGTVDWIFPKSCTNDPRVCASGVVNAKAAGQTGNMLLNSFNWVSAGGASNGTVTGFTGYTTAFSATAGDNIGNAALASSTAGTFIATTTGTGFGFSISAPANTVSRTLRIYAGVFSGTITLTATLSDGSASPATATIVSTAATSAYGYFTITYNSASPGQILNCTVLLTTNLGSSPNVVFVGATLQ